MIKVNPQHAYAHAQRPSEWVKYQKNLCVDCWAGCCTLPLEASVQDLIRLELTTEQEASESLKKLAQRLMKDHVLQSFNTKSQLFIFEQRHGCDCLYLGKDRLCTVYSKRPEVCRKFPKIGPRPGYCPYLKK